MRVVGHGWGVGNEEADRGVNIGAKNPLIEPESMCRASYGKMYDKK